MVDSSAACARGRAGPSWAGEAGRSQCQPLASPMTPIQRRYPRVIRVRGVAESTISRGAQQLGRLAERVDLRGRLLLARLQGLLAAVDPHHRDLLLQARLDVVVVRRPDVHPPFLAAHPALGLGEVGGVGFVGPDLLGRDHQVEVDRHVTAGLAEQLVVDVRNQPDLELLLELLERRVGLPKRPPALDGIGQEPRAGRLERPLELLRDPHRRAAQDFGVELVGAPLDVLLGLHEERDQPVALDREPVALGFPREGVGDPLLPIDEGPVDVERHPFDLLRQRHERAHYETRPSLGFSPPMDLLEYQGKQLFARHDVPVPTGIHATSVEEATQGAADIGYPCVIKAQVQIGGRGKAGGIKVAKDATEAEEHAKAILGMDIRGLTVRELWIEEASDIAAEYYASIVFDRSARAPLVMLSTKGGMDIEEVAAQDPGAIARLHVDPLLGFQDFHGRRLAFEAGVDADVVRPVGVLLAKLYDVFVAEEAMLVEVNPLIVTSEREVRALDAKVTLDGNSLFRHADNAALRKPSAEDEQEQMAKERGLTYVKLDGDIGILGNGAGLVMSTLDVVAQAGGKPANFLDAGGGSKADAIVSAVEVILSDEKVKAVLFNIFGGITRCDEVARGLIEAFEQVKVDVPFVVRLDGTNDKEGRRLLAEAELPNVHVEQTMLGAAALVVALASDREDHERRDADRRAQNAGLEAPRR